MEAESQEKYTQLSGSLRLPNGRQLPVTVTVDRAALYGAGISSTDALTLRAVEVFGDSEKAESWLDTSNSALGGATPRVTAQTKEGSSRILGILFDLEHGFPA